MSTRRNEGELWDGVWWTGLDGGGWGWTRWVVVDRVGRRLIGFRMGWGWAIKGWGLECMKWISRDY